MPNQNVLTWIHLSDLHIEPDDRFNRRIVLDALWQDIRGFIAEGSSFDFIAFTGDVSYSGANAEYILAASEFFDPLLSVSGVPRERLFIIPGNHDVSRPSTALLKNPIPTIKNQDSMRKMLADTSQRKLLLAPFDNYSSFVKSYTGDESAALSFLREFEKGDFLVSVVGLNSAWLSGFYRDEKGDVDDFGRLAVSEFQLFESLPKGAHFKIVLMHHPFDWLSDLDKSTTVGWLARNNCVVLRGHLHRPDVLGESNLSGELLTIPAGAIYDRRNSPNSYNIVRVDLTTGAGVVFLRRYNDSRTEWQKDTESTGDRADGQVDFRLPGFWYTATVKAGEQEASSRLEDYNLVFTENCKTDLASMGLAEEDLVALVQREFRSHLNYFRFDLEDYPLPLRINYILYMNKVGRQIEFNGLVPCTENEAQLASWNDILALYRRATRLAYREDPNSILLVRGMVRRASSLHLDLESRIEKHFEQFHKLLVHPGLRGGLVDVPTKDENTERIADEISFHILQSVRARHDAYEIVELMDAGDILEDKAIGIIVSALERSLQHIHKIILRYPPV